MTTQKLGTPKTTPLPLIFDSPHSGTDFPDDFDFACDKKSLERHADSFVHEIFDKAPEYGGYFLHALFPRTYIDVNRSALDIDHLLLSKPWPGPTKESEKSKLGVGLIRRLCLKDVAVYDRKLSPKEIKQRIDNYYWSYHNQIEKLYNDLYDKFGCVYHINCHSMPSHSPTTVKAVDPNVSRDFVLGDRDGTTCAPEFTQMIYDFLTDKGYAVAINKPYKGVELVRKYSSPKNNKHALQIEISRGLYMDQENIVKSENYENLKSDITDLIKHISDYVRHAL